MMDNSIEDICWSVQLNHEFKEKLLPFTMPKLKQAIAFLPLSLRLLFKNKINLLLIKIKLKFI